MLLWTMTMRWPFLRLGGIDGRILQFDWKSEIDWLESSMKLVDKQAFECLVTVLWNS